MLSNAWIYHMFCNSIDDVGKMDPYQKSAFDSEDMPPTQTCVGIIQSVGGLSGIQK